MSKIIAAIFGSMWLCDQRLFASRKFTRALEENDASLREVKTEAVKMSKSAKESIVRAEEEIKKVKSGVQDAI